MPCFGLSPFLLVDLIPILIKRECQCPASGFLHFYQISKNKYVFVYTMCQCPASGFLHFYKYADGKLDLLKNTCQCPASGFLHFYQNDGTGTQTQNTVSMPCFGLSPFLPKKLGSWHLYSSCVNALLRAFSISTLDSNGTLDGEKFVSMPCFGLSPFLQI